MQDFQCTGWINGWPTWVGGTGHEWLHCCVAHDLTPKSLSGDLALGVCVAQVAPIMGVIMGVGVMTLGTLYVWFKSKRKKD